MLKEIKDNCSMTIAGLDPSGGAGLLADAKTFHSHGIYATCVVTCITAQNPFEVNSIEALDVSLIEDEIDTILDVYPVRYIKTGMLYSRDIISLVSRKISEYQLKAVVDPVMVAESGANLSDDDFVKYFNKHMVKKSFLITPNIHEASLLSEVEICDEDTMIEAALKLSYDTNIVITGGHLNGNDILCCVGEINKIEGKLVKTKNTHGTGCTYSASITSNLIKKHDILTSCKKSRQYMTNTIKHGYNYTPNQFYKK